MSQNLQAYASLYDQLEYPVLFFDAEALRYQNPAALEQLPSLTHERAMEISNGIYRYGASCFTARVQTLHGQTLATLLPCDDPQRLSPQTLEIIAQTLRGSLSTAMSVSQLLIPQLELLEDSRIQLEAAMLNKSLYQMMRLSSNLSDTALLSQSEITLNRREIDLAAWLRELGETISSYCQLCGVQLRTSILDTPCWAFVDTACLRRAVLNLISNSLKFSTSGSLISISLERVKNQYQIKITDHGEGIPPEEIEQIFTRSSSRSLLGDPRWGVGLGLQLVQQIIRLHEGSMMVQSRAQEGFTVIISLKRLDAPQITSEVRRGNSCDYASGFDPFLMELSDALPAASFRLQQAE